MKMFLNIAIIHLLFLSTSAYATTECARPVSNLWNSLSSDKQVWVTFSDGGGAIYKTEGLITAGQMNRFFSQVLAAKTTGNKLVIRYPEDNLSCPPPAGINRNDVKGIWLAQ